MLIGSVETVPGTSGGTMALIVGVYDTAILSAGHLFSSARLALVDVPRGRGWARAGTEFRRIAWAMIIPLVIGMFAALVVMSNLMAGLVHDYPVRTKAVFFGLVLASLWVPYSLAAAVDDGVATRTGWRWRDLVIALGGAALGFVVVSLPPGHVEPTPVVIVVAAALAVSALVLPGLSGSFLLLTLGLYEPTLGAVNDRDFGYIGLFAIGAVIGLGSIVKVLQWLLDHHRRVTLVLLTGVMAGGLRALWPWQAHDRTLLAPGAHTSAAVGLAALSFVVVATVFVIDHTVVRKKRQQRADEDETTPAGVAG